MDKNSTTFSTDVFTTGGLYLYIWPFVLAMLALIIWGLNLYLGNTAPKGALALTPYMWPAAGLLTTIGIFFYYRLRGNFFIIKKQNGSYFGEIEMPGKEPLLISPIAEVIFVHHTYPIDDQYDHLDRYAVFINIDKRPGFKIRLSRRTMGIANTAGYKKMNEMPYGACPTFRGNTESIRKFCIKNSLTL